MNPPTYPPTDVRLHGATVTDGPEMTSHSQRYRYKPTNVTGTHTHVVSVMTTFYLCMSFMQSAGTL